MGETRVKKSKKASKQPEDASKPLKASLEKLSLADDQLNGSIPGSEKSPALTDSQDLSTAEDEDLIADPSYIEIINTESKGQAIFAARKIPAGTLVLADTPLIRLTQSEEDADKSNDSHTSNEDATSLITQFTSLPRPTQKSYLTLFDSQKSDFSTIKSIYYSNCYNLSGPTRPSKSSPGGSCIGLTASRLNHSCLPNVQFSFDESRNLMLFHAVKAIPRGREITSNYDSVFELAAQRQRRQMLYYGFRCDCEACDPGMNEFWMRSDERRKGMIEARRVSRECEKRWEETGKLEVGMDPVGALVRLEGLLIKEGLVGVPLADTYRSLGRWAERLGDVKAVERWRVRELEVCVTCFGRRSERVRELKKEKVGVVK